MKNNEHITSDDSINYKILKKNGKEISKEINNKYNLVNQLMLNSKILLPNELMAQSTKNSLYKKLNIKNFSTKNNNKKTENETANKKKGNTIYTTIYKSNQMHNKNLNNISQNISGDFIIIKREIKKNSSDIKYKDQKVGDSYIINDESLKNDEQDNNNNILIMDKKFNPSRNEIPKITRKTYEIFSKSDNTDKSYKNWDELKKNYIGEIKDKIKLKKPEPKNLIKLKFHKNNYYKFSFCRKKIQGLPIFYDTISTHMNRYYNKSEHNRHEILISELCKLRAYLLKYKIENSADVIKDFLIKHNIPNIKKYTTYQLMQFGQFVCQEDVYKINSLLKPYMNIKDMINDILENSEKFNQKFPSFKFNSSIKHLLNNIKTNSGNSFSLNNSNISSPKTVKSQKNKKFYISELDGPINQKENISNIKNEIKPQKENEINQNKTTNENSTNNNLNIIEDKKSNENEQKDFNDFNQKRKEILKNVGIKKKYSFINNDYKESYFSPLFNRKSIQANYFNNIKKFKLPKISNNVSSIGTFYKPNKFILSPDKDYSLNFSLLYKDISNELNNFQSDYEHKFDSDTQRKTKSCEKDYSNNKSSLKKKKLKDNIRLFFGKKDIKVDFQEIQKKHKLTEYIALLNAKKHIKDDIINDNIINY